MCLRLAPLLTLPVWLGCEVGKTETRPICADLAQGVGGAAGNAPVAGSGGTVYAIEDPPGVWTPTPLLMTPLEQSLPTDSGPSCLDCTQGRDIEHVVVVDFEDGYAPAWFGFDEGSFTRAPAATPVGQPNEPPYWGLHVADLASSPARPRCGSQYALRLQGGPYSQWGGGVGTSYFRLKGGQIAQYCPPRVASIAPATELPQDECGFSVVPAYEQTVVPNTMVRQRVYMPSPYNRSIAGFDASQFDGIAFYARHAPGAQAGLQISIEDFNTSDQAALTAQIEQLTGELAPNEILLGGRAPACTRAKECCGPTSLETGRRPRCNVVNVEYGAQVSSYGFTDTTSMDFQSQRPVREYRCYVAGTDRPPPVRVAKVEPPTPEWTAWDDWAQDHPLCCPTDFEDPQFGRSPIPEMSEPEERQKACVPYVVEGNFTNAGTQYCWNEGDPPIPPADANRCGDGFRKFVTLSTEWKLFQIPWSELRRSTMGKAPIDTSSIWGIAFYWRQGMLDTYIDDFGFYKKRQP
jgi:hypothetical protein